MTRSAGPRIRELHLYRRYFDLVAAGEKTIEVRVKYPTSKTSPPESRSASGSRTRTRAATSA